MCKKEFDTLDPSNYSVDGVLQQFVSSYFVNGTPSRPASPTHSLRGSWDEKRKGGDAFARLAADHRSFQSLSRSHSFEQIAIPVDDFGPRGLLKDKNKDKDRKPLSYSSPSSLSYWELFKMSLMNSYRARPQPRWRLLAVLVLSVCLFFSLSFAYHLATRLPDVVTYSPGNGPLFVCFFDF